MSKANILNELAILGAKPPVLPGKVHQGIFRFIGNLPTVKGTGVSLLATIVDPVINELDVSGSQFYMLMDAYAAQVVGIEDESEVLLDQVIRAMYFRWKQGNNSLVKAFSPASLTTPAVHTQNQSGDSTAWTAVDRQSAFRGFRMEAMYPLLVDAESATFELYTGEALTVTGTPTVTLYCRGYIWDKGEGNPFNQQALDCLRPSVADVNVAGNRIAGMNPALAARARSLPNKLGYIG